MDKLSEPDWTRSNITDLKGYRITHIISRKAKSADYTEIWGKKHFWQKPTCIMMILTSSGMCADVYDGAGNCFEYKA